MMGRCIFLDKKEIYKVGLLMANIYSSNPISVSIGFNKFCLF